MNFPFASGLRCFAAPALFIGAALSTIAQVDSLRYPGEKHLANLRQLTFGGDNAEAYWSFDGSSLVFQSTRMEWGAACDQIYVLPLNADYRPTPEQPREVARVSNGQGRTTCAYFLPGDSSVVYASTHLADEACPAVPPRGPGGEYVWPIYEGYDIFTTDIHGASLKQLTFTPGYDAEATVSPRGDRMVFTSMRSGDLELYTCALDGSDVRQVTRELGYDGGAFFSPDGEWLVWRASRPQTPEAQAHYRELLAKGLVEPTEMELFIGRVDGSETRQLTRLGGANWAPFFHPSGEKILFCTNHHTGGFPFNLFMIRTDGTGLEQITFDNAFDSFPMFSPDGKRLVFASNRNNGRTRSTNLFVADWVD
jgi:Tol biopolymer transport system component